ncbi:MAG: flagellar biosynthesis protein FlhF [Acidobacteria bacterium]|nr:flagellar biosynthesis protein FlhF [Acidobacteriota bacterium]
MKIKTFFGDTMRQALDLVKRELGINALILSSRRVKSRPGLDRNGSMVYEVTAALDGEVEPLRAAAVVSGDTATDYARSALDAVGRGRPTDPIREDQGCSLAYSPSYGIESRDELVRLRRLIYSLMAPNLMRRSALPNEASRTVLSEMLANDMDEPLAYDLLERAREKLSGEEHLSTQKWSDAARRALAEMITVAPLEDSHAPAGHNRTVAAFIGPTGVGKTTTIAKLAARYTLEHQRKVLLVTLDTYRIAAIEQLRTYAGIIGAPIEVIADVAGLDRALAEHAQKDIVLIDTVGCSQREAGRMKALSMYMRDTPSIQKHLVLSATTKSIDLDEIIDQFSIFGSTQLLFTKLDETSTFGPIINKLVRTRKPLSYFTNGQKVPEDLTIPTARDVAGLMIPAVWNN